MLKTILRRPKVSEATGDSRSTLYLKIKDGTFPPPVSLGARSVGWPSYEINAINAARIAGKSKDEIRALVKELITARKTADCGLDHPLGRGAK